MEPAQNKGFLVNPTHVGVVLTKICKKPTQYGIYPTYVGVALQYREIISRKKDILGSLNVKKENYDLLEVVMIYVGKDTTLGKSKSINLIKTIFNIDDPKTIKDQMTTLGYSKSSLEKEAIGMKTFSDALIERTIERTREKTAKETKTSKEKEIVNNMLKNGITPTDISKWTGIKLEFVETIVNALKEED